MKKGRIFLYLIIFFIPILIGLDIPKVPVNINIWKIKYVGTIGDPEINWKVAGTSILSKNINTSLGLDLKGGSELILQADMSKISSDQRNQALESVKNVIENRVNRYGIAEPTIYTEITGGNYRVIVDLAGVKDINQAKTLLGETADLELFTVKPDATTLTSDSLIPAGISGADLKGAQITYQSNSISPSIQLQFTDKGLKKFSDLAKANVGRPVVVMLDGQVISAPVINQDLANGVVSDPVIEGTFTLDQAQTLVTQLDAGALPVPVSIVQESTVAASLGTDSIKASLIAGIVGIIIVFLFMIWNYGVLGVFADLALILYTLITYSIFRLIPVTLTLAGIAGFILSIGMAVDANILIFERAKEELRKGNNFNKAIELGFNRAWPSIRDSNVSSLITTTILFMFGTSIIKGFALTLAIGVLVSLFTAVIITRTFLREYVELLNFIKKFRQKKYES